MFLPNLLPSDNEKIIRASNPMPYPEYLYSSKSTFLVTLTAQYKEFSNVKSALCLHSYKLIS